MTPASVLYSLRTEIDREGATRYRITKFVDGEVESSYHTSREACECPAGVRPTCRHRQMLPQMLNADIANTHWFMDWDHGGAVVDFEGVTRAAYERAEREAEIAKAEPLSDIQRWDRIINRPHELRNPQPHSTMVSATDFDSVDGGSNPPAVATTPAASPAKHPWRRL